MLDDGESSFEEFEEFVAARSVELLRVAYAVCGSAQDAEDVLQAAPEKTYRRWSRIRHRDPEPYVRKIVVNTAISGHRRRKSRPEVHLASVPETAVHSGDEATDLRDVLFAELRRLPPRQRAVLVLRFWMDLSEAETAETLGCSVGSVKSQASRGLARLRESVPSFTRES
jgi:RNA polymerase sigma-70 factor (sigma-E family)